jgi:MFS family permease
LTSFPRAPHDARVSNAVALRAYREVGANRSMRRALFAYLCFNAQEFGIWIAVTLYAFDRGGATAAGLVCVAMLVPAALVAPLGSVLGDRIRRDHALAIGYGIQALAAAILALALATAPPILAYVAAIVSACAVTLTRPVHNAILPELADTPEQLTAANSVSGTVEGLGLIAGPIVNSIVIAMWGPGAVCAIFSALMLLAAGLTWRLMLHAVGTATATDRTEHASVVREVLDAGRVLRADVPAGTLTVFGGGQYFVLGLLDVFYAVLAVDVLGLGQGGAGVLAAAVGLGGLIGAVATAILVGRRRLATWIEVAVGVMAGALAAVALAEAIGPVLVLLAAVGAARSFFDVAARTLLQRSVPETVLARVFGLQEALIMIALAFGSAAAPVFVVIFGEQAAFLAVSVLAAVAGLAVFPALRSLDRRATIPDPERLALLHSVSMFGVLDQPRLERIAASMVVVHVPAGDAFIREGEPGDRFYLIGAGDAAVVSRGRTLATVGRGDYVGEIALLRDVPRTADVVALTDLQLLALERTEFLAALSGRGMDAGGEEVERRLRELRELDEGSGSPES